ncbi:MAG: MFS transporter [Nocardioidaceae bacterium]
MQDYRDEHASPPPKRAAGEAAGVGHHPRAARVARAAEISGRATGRAARASGRLASGGVRRARRFTNAQGADTSGLARLLELHIFSTAGDAAVAISLAGTLFFQVPSGSARTSVLTFLLLTMLPFAIVAPLIGPFLDRFRRGRRWAIGATMAVRAFCCWVLAGAVNDSSATLFPAALGVLVAGKAYGVTRSSAVPRVLPDGFTLVKANSRISLTGTGGVIVSAPIVGLLVKIGAEWALRYAALLFAIATILAVLLPARVDSSEGEEQVTMSALGGNTRRGRRVGVTSTVVNGLRCNAALRFLYGFLTIYLAFELRTHPFAGWHGKETLLLGFVIGALGLGNTVGTALASLLKARRPDATVMITMLAAGALMVVATLLYGFLVAVVVALCVGICGSLGKLSLDALIQRDIPEAVRTSVFARSETLVQLCWVVGGFFGVLLPLGEPRVSLGVATVLVAAWAVVVVRGAVAHRDRSQPAT